MTQTMIKDHYDILTRALQALSARCDGAQNEDGIGFNGRDTDFGKSLARQSKEKMLSEAQQKHGIKMLQTYRKQLEGMGFDIPLPIDYIKRAVAVTQVTASAPAKPAKVSVESHIERVGYDLRIKIGDKNFNQDCSNVKNLSKRRFDGNTKEWVVPGTLLDKVLYALPNATLGAGIVRPANTPAPAPKPVQPVVAVQAPAPVANPINIGVDLSKPLPGGIELFKHQQEDVERMARNGSLIVGNEVGTGKTFTLLTSAMILHKLHGWKVIVVTKASLKDDIGGSAATLGVPIEVYSWAKMPAPPDVPYIFIADEAHMAQGAANAAHKQTIRGKAFLELAAHPNCKACWPATGTPMRNGQPRNMWPLLRAINHPVALNKWQYERDFCNGRPTNFTKWDTSGASNLELLNKLISDKMIRRKKEDCLDLPPQMMTIRKVNLAGKAWKLFNDAMYQMECDYAERKQIKINDLVARLELDPDDKQAMKHLANIDNADAMVLLGQLRQANSLAKVDEAIELAEEILGQGSSVVISTEFLESAELIAEALKDWKAELLTGSVTGQEKGMKISKRQAMIDRFQRKESRVFVMTGSAGGTGVTLTAAQDMILVDRPLISDDVIQLHGRLHRISQTGTVTLHWLQAQDIDRKLDENLVGKLNNSSTVVDGNKMADLARDIIKQMFGGRI